MANESQLNETTGSAFEDEEWLKLFPSAGTALGPERQNIKYIKKLVAVAVSNILYLRADLPDAAFTIRTLGSLQLRVLHKMKGAEGEESAANAIIELIKDGMTAIDKGYLRKMTLVIFEGEDDAEEGDMRKAYEAYSFYFGQQDKDFSLNRSSKDHGVQNITESGSNTPSELTEIKVMKATRRLLRRLIAATQELDVLPEIASLNVCLEYYDDVTPDDYEPKGFVPSEYSPQVNTSEEDGDPHFMGMGQVDLMNKKIALRLNTKSKVLQETDELHPASIEKASQENGSNIDMVEPSVSYKTAEESRKAKCKNRGDETQNLIEESPARARKNDKMKMKRHQLEDELNSSEREEENASKKYKRWAVQDSAVKI